MSDSVNIPPEIKKKKFAKIAVISFVMGLFSLVPALGVLFSLFAIPVGLIAVIFTSIKKNVLRGRGLAISGLLLGLLGFFSCAALMKMTCCPFNYELTALFKSNRGSFEELRDMFLELLAIVGYAFVLIMVFYARKKNKIFASKGFPVMVIALLLGTTSAFMDFFSEIYWFDTLEIFLRFKFVYLILQIASLALFALSLILVFKFTKFMMGED